MSMLKTGMNVSKSRQNAFFSPQWARTFKGLGKVATIRTPVRFFFKKRNVEIIFKNFILFYFTH